MISSIKMLADQAVIKPSSGQHWDLLDGLRGLAILMVVACHGFYTNPEGAKLLQMVGNFISGGAIGVQMFFVLSGFLISYPLLRVKDANPAAWYVPGYIIRRFLKIFPPFFLCILLLALTYRFVDGNFDRTRSGLQWSLGIPHFIYLPDAPLFNGSFWSLWVEIGFYVVLPFFFLILRRQSSVNTTAGVIALTLFVISVASSLLTWPSENRPGSFMLYIIGRFPNCLSNFGWGVLFAGGV
jgi:peptidoglycan/LPS O-acetylase OafA/YrhL